MPFHRSTIRRIAIAAAALAAATHVHAFELRVEIATPRPGQGMIAAAVYDSAGVWMNMAKAVRLLQQPAKDRTVLVFNDLPTGTYAVAVIHDENGNGKLDTNPAGLPVEPYGFSRDARGNFGPPSFEAASISLDRDTTLAVTLR